MSLPSSTRRARGLWALMLAGAPAAAQQVPAPWIGGPDSAAVVAGPQYDAGGLKRSLLGEEYRDLWTAPVRVPVLDLDGFAGGLELVGRAGRKQTKSLRFVAADGREFLFRSVDKDPLLALTPDLDGTLAGDLLRDQTSAMFPAGAVALPPLLLAAGVIHVVPQLAVMPDDPRLGEHRQEFAGMLGMIEERPDEGEDDQLRVAGSDLVIGSDRLRERLLGGPDDRVDSRALLVARLMDALLNDRDRHWDQWRWARFERDGTRYWHPIPEDRDYVFIDFNGILPSAARWVVPHIIAFGEQLPDHQALSHNSFDMDRRLLADLPRPAWDSVTTALQASLTDDAISDAVSALPPSYQAHIGDRLERALRARRDGLHAFAREWYAWLSTEVDVHGTDEADLATAEYDPDGGLRVRLYGMEDGDPDREPFFERRFLAGETSDVRLHLHGGDDRAVVRGDGRRSGIAVRVVGGDGDDVLADSSRAPRGSRVAFYDDSGEENLLLPGRGTRIDTLPFTAPTAEEPLTGARYRDFGSSRRLDPVLSYGSVLGLVVGGGPTWTRYGFRQVPYASEVSVSAAYSFRVNAVGIEMEGDWRRPNSVGGASLRAQATQLEPFYFFGLGNETPTPPDDDPFLVERDLLLVHPALDYQFAPRSRISVGPVLKYSYLRPREASRAAPGAPDRGGFGQLGGRVEAVVDLRDNDAFPRSGVLASFGGSAHAGAWDVAAPFGELSSAVSTYFSLPGRRGPTLALRGGAMQVWGDFPPHEAAFLGGWSTLRGYELQRFAGDAAVWGAAELRSFLMRANLLVRGDLGALVFADAGRVYLSGESPGGWHTGTGAGLYFIFEFQGLPISSTALYARGDTEKVRVQLGVPF